MFFDSDMLLKRIWDDMRGGRRKADLQSIYDTSRSTRNNGVHISFAAQKLITTELVTSLGWLSSVKAERFRGAGWLRNYLVKSARVG